MNILTTKSHTNSISLSMVSIETVNCNVEEQELFNFNI